MRSSRQARVQPVRDTSPVSVGCVLAAAEEDLLTRRARSRCPSAARSSMRFRRTGQAQSLPRAWVSAPIVWQIVQLLDELEQVVGQHVQRLGRL